MDKIKVEFKRTGEEFVYNLELPDKKATKKFTIKFRYYGTVMDEFAELLNGAVNKVRIDNIVIRSDGKVWDINSDVPSSSVTLTKDQLIFLINEMISKAEKHKVRKVEYYKIQYNDQPLKILKLHISWDKLHQLINWDFSKGEFRIDEQQKVKEIINEVNGRDSWDVEFILRYQKVILTSDEYDAFKEVVEEYQMDQKL